MTLDDPIDFTLLARYFAGECTGEERAAVDLWAAEPGHDEEMVALRRLWQNAQTVPAVERVDAMWSQLAQRMHANGAGGTATAIPTAAAARRPSAPVLSLYSRPRRVRQWIAGGLLAAAVVPVAFVVVQRRGRTPVRSVAEASPMREFHTSRGQRTTLDLPDGTRVQLGYASTLRMAPFTSGPRELYLEGEAVFDVVHDPKRPFIVQTARSRTEDLGTVFAVRAYPTDREVRVTVASGQVALREKGAAAGAATTVRAGQLANLDSTGRVTISGSSGTDELLAWQRGRIQFRNERLDDVAADLERRYDVTIRIPATAADRRITVDMQARSLNEVLDAIALHLRLSYRLAGSVVDLEVQHP